MTITEESAMTPVDWYVEGIDFDNRSGSAARASLSGLPSQRSPPRGLEAPEITRG
jgi:hypothetical protein